MVVLRHTWLSRHGRTGGGLRVLVAASGGIATTFLTDVTGVLSWFFMLEVFVLRWCHPVRAGGVFVLLGARRRWSFLREGPTGRLYTWSFQYMLSMLPSPCGTFILCFGVVLGRAVLEPPLDEDTITQCRDSGKRRDGSMRRDYNREIGYGFSKSRVRLLSSSRAHAGQRRRGGSRGPRS
ncbi:hypothetical protein Taro_042922 [Colocasia esculenta]|uniref:Uncharacterized protein n=1 Tax=Colocasia esculenta TaxID=4460 RepID=A0A843WZK2_COLES|nr:hypothetical protein [Colocasia esculenta]